MPATPHRSVLGVLLVLLLLLLPGAAGAAPLYGPNEPLSISAGAQATPGLTAASPFHTEVHTYFVAEREGGAARSAGRIAETLGRA